MDNKDLSKLLDELDSCIEDEIPDFFKQSSLSSIFSKLINIIIWEDASLDDEVINKLDILTDNMDSFNFGDVKENIKELKDLL